MKIREAKRQDKPSIDKIYDTYFSANEYPDFFNKEEKFQCPFVVTDDNEKIILASGIKLIAEAVVVTDRSFPVKTRLDALLQTLGSTILIAKEMKYRQVYAFVNRDETYVKVLQRYGFRLLDAKLLVFDFGAE